MIGWYLKRVDPVLARVWKVSTEKSVHELTNWEVEKDAWVREFHEEVYTLELCPRRVMVYRAFRAGLGCPRFRRNHWSRISFTCLGSRVSPADPDSSAC